MTDTELKADLHRYLHAARDAVVWKLEGLAERDLRRPMTRTGTNLLGLVKHLSGVEAGYLGAVFGRPFAESLTWMEEDAEPNADMWATAEESVDDVVALYGRVRAHSDDTIAALPLDAPGAVTWWPAERRRVTLHQVLVHLVAETNRHAGHADVVRELVDGSAGLREGNDNLAPGDETWWKDYRQRLKDVAEQAAGR